MLLLLLLVPGSESREKPDSSRPKLCGSSFEEMEDDEVTLSDGEEWSNPLSLLVHFV